MTLTALPKDARYRALYDYYPDDDLSLGPVPRVRDVTDEVTTLIKDNAQHREVIASLCQELADIKNRRSWETLETSTDPKTGMVVTVRTIWRWQQEAMMVTSTQEHLSRYGW